MLAQDTAGQSARQAAWILELHPGIEWARPLGHRPTAALAVEAADNHLWIIDTASGRRLVTKPIHVGCDARLVPLPDDCPPDAPVYIFDRHGACALRARAPFDPAWRFGRPGSTDEPPDSDPEVLTGWMCAGVLGRDLLLVGDDGRVVLLSATTGRPRWETRLGPLPVARLHTAGTVAVVLYKSAGRVRTAFIDCSDERPLLTGRLLNGDWPLSSELVPDGLVTVSTERVTLWPPVGPPRRIVLRATDLKAAALAICTPPDAARAAVSQLWLAEAGRLERYELSFPDVSPPGPSVAVRCNHGVETVSVSGSHVLACGESAASVFAVDDGAVLATCRQDAGRLVAGHISSERLYAVFTSGAATDEALTLAWADLLRPTATARHGPTHRSVVLRRGGPGGPRQVLWPADHVVLVEPTGIRAYKLP